MLEGIEKIEGLTEEQQAAINELASGVVNKKNELLEKLKGAKELTAAEQAKLNELEQFKSQAEIKAAEDAANWEEAARLKDEAHNKALEEWKGKYSQTEENLRTVLIDNGLSNALDSVNINKDLKAGAIAMLQGSATITEGKAMIGEKTLSEAVKEWAASDQGKAFCLAPINNGGGSGGGGQAQAPNKPYSEMTTQEQVAFLSTKVN